MTKVLFWNLRNFTNTRIPNLLIKYPGLIANPLEYIEQSFELTDILVLIEEYHRFGGVYGQLGFGSGGQGAFNLHDHINKLFPADQWHLVPPIVTGGGGRAEAIAVYYKGTTLEFTGPWFANGLTTDPLVFNAYVNAPIDWNQTLPAKSQNKGGQWYFKSIATGAKANFKAGYRDPWLVTFQELGGTNRKIQVTGVHSPAPGDGGQVKGVGKLASDYLDYLADLHEIQNNPHGADIGIIGGDFNIDASVPQGEASFNNFATNIFYEWGFRDKLDISYPQQVFPNTSQRSHNQLPIQNLEDNYPNSVFGSSSYDQIFAAGPKGFAIQKQMVLNAVIGVDSVAFGGLREYGFTNVWPEAGGYSAGWDFTTVMAQDIPAIIGSTLGAINPILTSINVFKGWGNYFHIRYTSDHMGVVCEV